MASVEASLPNKEENMGKWYSEILEKAELIDWRYGVKGFVVYRPYGMEIMKKITSLYEKGLEDNGHRPILFPLVIPEKNIRRESKHIKGFEGEVFWIEKGGFTPLEERLALRPTSETAIYPLYSLWLKSYKDLPFKAYQTVAVYRYETKATRPLLRGREFLWIETHDVFSEANEARQQTVYDAEIFWKVTYEELGMPFLHIKREEFDKFAGAEETFAFDTLLPDGRVLQIGTTHYLGTNFTKAFDVVIHDEEGGYKYPHSTCFGIGLSRLLASIALVHGDEFGLVLPFDIAPIQVVIIPIYKAGEDNEGIRKYCKDIYMNLRANDVRVVFDDGEKTPGEKYYYYDMRGVPFRVEVGPREFKNDTVTVFRRDIRKRKTVESDVLVEFIMSERDSILEMLRNRAEKRLIESIEPVKDREELIRLAKRKRKIFKTFFCGRKECAEELKEELGGYEVRGSPTKESEEGACIWCGLKGHLAYIAKAY